MQSMKKTRQEIVKRTLYRILTSATIKGEGGEAVRNLGRKRRHGREIEIDAS